MTIQKPTLPAYPGGRQFLFPDGCGLTDDLKTESPPELCEIRIVEKTDESAFLTYCEALAAAGFRRTWERTEPAGIYREMRKEGALLYLYYVPAEHTARIIFDQVSAPLAEFAAEAQDAGRGDVTLMQFGLYYDRMIKGTTCDCGMNYALKLTNGEFIIIDGGEAEQATDAACAEFLRRLRAQTGEKTVTVALWICTHPHDDHMDFFLKLLRVCDDGLRLKRVMFNFPSHSLLPMAPYISRMKERLSARKGEFRLLKAHTGQRFSLGGVTADVLLTQEDALHTEGERRYSGTNQTSLVLKLTAADFSFTVLADIPEENGDKLVSRYRNGEADCTFLQAAHHCINRIEDVYRHIRAQYVLIPEKTEMILQHMRENYETIRQYHPAETVFPAGDATTVFSFPDGRLRIEQWPIVGGAYDGSEI